MNPTTAWTAEDLDRIGDAEELQLASHRRDGTLRPYVPMWVVRVGHQLYVRSAYGPDNPWYRRATASRQGRIRAGGTARDVTVADAAPDAHASIDAAYHAKHHRYGPGTVGSGAGPLVAPVTIRLVPHPDYGLRLQQKTTPEDIR